MSPFDEEIDRVATHCSKWDTMESHYGVSPQDGISMWVADMDFRPPDCIQKAVESMAAHGIYGYYGDQTEYKNAICWWMENRHGWKVDPDWIFSVNGLVNGTGLCVDAFTQPGEGVVVFTPVYHAFFRVIRNAGRTVVECPLKLVDGRYEMDFDAYDAQMTGSERMVLLCSPHNPGGRVWSRAELKGVGEFCKRHGLILVSDEIHHDIVMPGNTHTPMALIDPALTERLVMMTACSKTFSIAGAHVGNVVIEDPDLRARFGKSVTALGISPGSFGQHMATAGYSPEGAAWVDALCEYLDGNRRLFDEAINTIPGLSSVPLEATYLAWVDFAGTGMTSDEYKARVQQTARIAASHGETFGAGGETFLRFNIATPRARVQKACQRLQDAFSDLQ